MAAAVSQIHDWLERIGEQFTTWSEEFARIERENQRVEFQRCVVEIETDLQHYRELMAQLPTVEEFTDEDVEIRSGKVFKLFDVVWEVKALKNDLSRKFERCTLCSMDSFSGRRPARRGAAIECFVA